MNQKHHTIALRALGALYLMVGIASALLGPIELYVFYLFSEGGRFHFAGFGFGSFMFGFIAIQIIGYYVIGALLIPLGYGHLRLRAWARQLALALLLCWLVLGVPVLFMIALTVFSFKDPSIAAAIVLLIALATTYPLLPLLLIRLYRGAGVRGAFASRGQDGPTSWLEAVPVRSLALAILLAFLAVVLHFPILFNGLFPAFGVWLTGISGIAALTAAIAVSLLLAWAVLQRYPWAWQVSTIFFGLLSASIMLTFALTRYADLLELIHFPPSELEMLGGIPLRGWMLAVFFGLPLAGSAAVALAARADHLQRDGASESIGSEQIV